MIDEYVVQFWKKYQNSNDIERYEMVKSLAKVVDDCYIIEDKNLRLHCIASLLKSYIDDVIEVCRLQTS